MKKYLLGLLWLVCTAGLAQTFPVQNLTVAGNATFTLSPTGPTPTTGDSSSKLATTAFVQQSGLHYQQASGSNFSTNTSLAASQMGSWGIVTAAGVTVTLPAVASTQAGQSFTFAPSTNSFTIKGNASETINLAGTSANTQTFGPGESVTVTSNGSDWYVSNGGVTSKAPGCLSIMAFGGNNGGSVDNAVALNAAIAAQTSNRICVYFPPGKYAFASRYIYNFPNSIASITFLGNGQDVTTLFWNGGGGLLFNFANDANSIHIRDLSITTGSSVSGPVGIDVQNTTGTTFATNQTASDITNVTVRGDDGIGASKYWQYGIYLNGVSNFNLTNVFVIGETTHTNGNGVFFGGTATTVPIVLNVQGSQFNELNQGIIYGNYAQGVTVNQSNFTNDNIGINVPASESALDQLNVSNSQFNCFTYGIGLNTGVIQTGIVGNLFLIQQNANGVYANNYYSTTIVGNNFANAGSVASATGISFVTNQALNSIVTGNTFSSITTGVNLQSGSKNVSVQSNAYSGNANNVINNCSSGCSVGAATP